MEGKPAKNRDDGSDDSRQPELFQNPAESPVGAGSHAGNGSNERGSKLSELRRQRPDIGRSFPPVLQNPFELRGLAPDFENRTALDASDIESAATVEFGVFPGDVDSPIGQESGNSRTKNDGRNLVAPQGKFCFFAAIAQAVRANEETPDVPICVVLVDPWRWRGGVSHGHALPRVGQDH